MGYYIPNSLDLSKDSNATQIQRPISFKDFEAEHPDHALICEVDNGPFVANGLIYSESEFIAFNQPTDHRRKRWFMMNKEVAHELSGFKRSRFYTK